MNSTTPSLRAGTPWPLGASMTEDGCNFAVYSEGATSITLCLFSESEQEIARFVLPARTGNIWHGHVTGVRMGQCYGYRVDGPYAPDQGFLFDKSKLLIDPYAIALTRQMRWDASVLSPPTTQLDEVPVGLKPLDSSNIVPKGVIYDRTSFDWRHDRRPQIDPNQRIIYELHVKGFTQLHPEVPEAYRGKYLGLCSDEVINYLKKLGVTTIQLMPCFSFMTESRLLEKGLENYWGYNPVNFFAPDWRYAVEDPVAEFKHMVRTLHESGLEVILDVVYNHTAEGEVDEGTFSFKGLDSKTYYLYEDHFQSFTNYSGCGNTVNIHHPQVRRLVADSLRYWVEEMHVDGFRFDLGVALGRHGEHYSKEACLFGIIEQDPVLSQTLLVAEPWDIGPHGYQLGNFPDHWTEVNDRFRDTARAFWRGDTGYLADFATRILGSRDHFDRSRRSHTTSVNHVTYHDGFTLEDLVSYTVRHNHDNGEDNRDGHGHNISINHGSEGPTEDDDIIARRQLHKRNLMATLFLSRGTPHLLAGDEFGRTQGGNNNAYCQDNEVSWVHWDFDEINLAFLNFCQELIKVRKGRVGSLNALALDSEPYHLFNQFDHVEWLTDTGEALNDSQWHDPENPFIAVLAVGPKRKDAITRLILINAGELQTYFYAPVRFTGLRFECVLCTAEQGPSAIQQLGQRITVPAQSLSYLILKD